MCEEELQGVLDESPNTPPRQPSPCRVAGQWASEETIRLYWAMVAVIVKLWRESQTLKGQLGI